MDFEAITTKVGGCGLYHYITFALLAIATFKPAVDLQGLTFALYEPQFECDIEHVNGKFSEISEDQCSYSTDNNITWSPCKKWIFENTTMKSSLISELDLVCSRDYYKEIIYTFYFVGELIGYPVTILSDKVGRRAILLSFLFLSIPITLVQIMSYNFWVLLTFVFISGGVRTVYVGLAYTTLVEIMPLEKLDVTATNFWIFYALGYISTAAFAYLCRSWRWIYFLSLIPCASYLLYFCFVPETPMWLMLNGKKEQSFRTMTFIAKVNSRVLVRKDFDKWVPIEQETGRIWELFRYKRLVVRCLILTFAAWSFSFAYIGVSTDLKFASDNIFLSTLMMGLVEIPTGPLAAILAKCMSRKRCVLSLTSFGIICLIIIPFMKSDPIQSSWQPWVKVTLAMGGKLGFTSAWCVFDVITNELMPTTIRNGAMSIIYISVGIGSIVAPMVQNVFVGWYYAFPCFIYSIFLLATIILVMLFIPETKNLPLPQTVLQAASLEKDKEDQWKKNMMAEEENHYEETSI